MFIINKKLGETPLETLNNFKSNLPKEELYKITEKKKKKKLNLLMQED